MSRMEDLRQARGLKVLKPARQPLVAAVDLGASKVTCFIMKPDGVNRAGRTLALLRSRPQLLQRMEALVRVDDRRWDIRLNDGGLIQLPAENEDSALIQLDQLDQKARILELGFARIDLRDPEMVAVRPREGGVAVQPAPAVKGA